jgi:hypothetical protein
MTFARIVIANGIDKIHTLSNESALPTLGDKICSEDGVAMPQDARYIGLISVASSS